MSWIALIEVIFSMIQWIYKKIKYTRKCLYSYMHFSHILLILVSNINKSLWLLHLQELRAAPWRTSQIHHDSFISWWEISRWLLERGYYSRNGSLRTCTIFYISAYSICSQLLLETEKCAINWVLANTDTLNILKNDVPSLKSCLWSFPTMISSINLIHKKL